MRKEHQPITPEQIEKGFPSLARRYGLPENLTPEQKDNLMEMDRRFRENWVDVLVLGGIDFVRRNIFRRGVPGG